MPRNFRLEPHNGVDHPLQQDDMICGMNPTNPAAIPDIVAAEPVVRGRRNGDEVIGASLSMPLSKAWFVILLLVLSVAVRSAAAPPPVTHASQPLVLEPELTPIAPGTITLTQSIQDGFDNYTPNSSANFVIDIPPSAWGNASPILLANATGGQFGWGSALSDSGSIDFDNPAVSGVIDAQAAPNMLTAGPIATRHLHIRWLLWAALAGGFLVLVLLALRGTAAGNAQSGSPATIAPASVSQSTLGVIMRNAISNAWIVIVILILSIAGGYGVNWWRETYRPRYTATGWVQVEAPTIINPVMGGPATEDLGALALEQRTTAGLLKNATLFANVIKRDEVQKTTWYQQFKDGPPGQAAAAAADLAENVTVKSLPGTSLITVAMTCNDPKDARTIAEAVATQHMIDQDEANRTERNERTTVLNNAKKNYSAQKSEISAMVLASAAKLNINADGSSAKITAIDNDLANLTRVQTDLQIALNNAQVQQDDLTGQISDGVDPIQVGKQADADPRVLMDLKTLNELKLDELSAPPASEPADAASNLQARIKAVQQMLDDDTARAKNEARAELLGTLKIQINQIQRSLSSIAAEMRDKQNQQTDLSLEMTKYLTNKKTEAGYTDLIDSANRQLDQINNILQTKYASGVRWARLPVTPDKPDSPRKPTPPVTMAIAVAIGLFLSLAIALARRHRG
jgi:capsular polysaccharide biosynthesis protein